MGAPIKQRMGKVELIAFLGLISATPPIATDLFLPALPEMPGELGAPASVVNLAVTCYFLMQSVGMLMFGPISDRYGRKRPLFVGLALFCGCSLLCGLSNNAALLIIGRIFQGLGGGGVVAIATALVKDCYEGEERQSTLVAIQAIINVAPLVAPLLGSALLAFISWRGTFFAQTVVGLIALVGAIRLIEPVPPEARTTGNPLRSFAGIGRVAKNKLFMVMLVCASVSNLALIAYITTASYVYIDIFGTSTFVYSLFFAGNALITLLFATTLPKLLKVVSPKTALTGFFLIYCLAGVAMVFIGGLSPFAFLPCVTVINMCTMVIRPVSVNTLLGLQDRDTGSASALINFSFALFGSLGSLSTALPWPNYIFGIAVVAIVTGLFSSVVWMFLKKRV